MIDKEFLKSKLTYVNEDEHKIQDGDFIPIDVVEMLSKATKAQLQECFVKYNGNIPNKQGYKVETKCSRCGELIVVSLLKSQLIDHLVHYDGVSACCNECYVKWQEEEKQRREEKIKEQAAKEELSIKAKEERT